MSSRRRIVFAIILGAALCFGSVAHALDRTTTQRVMTSVVQLIAMDQLPSGTLRPLWTGSGTIVSADGLILTNCHVAYPQAMYRGSEYKYDLLVVAITTRSDEPPELTYIAEVVQTSRSLDLAVVRITQTIDGDPIDADELSLPFIELGDSDQLEIGEPIYILGYPGIGGETITFTSGNVSGFSGERGVDGRAWIKTDATVAGGNSGGTAVDDQGRLIGVPTQFGAGNDDDDTVDCRPVADTNEDGRIDDKDHCVTMGGFINAVRPANLAAPLIAAARLGITPDPVATPEPTPAPRTSTPSIGRVVFAPALTIDDQPVTVVQSLPRASTDIYVIFDYSGMANGVQFQPELRFFDQPVEGIWAPGTWHGGESGTHWISVHADPLGNATYQFSLLYDGVSMPLGSIRVGGVPKLLATFSDLTFAPSAEQPGLVPAGTTTVTAAFAYSNLPEGQAWSYRWYQDGTLLGEAPGPELSAGAGNHSLELATGAPLAQGTYRLELLLDDHLAATADFGVPGGAAEAAVLGPIEFSRSISADGVPIGIASTFRGTTRQLYATFAYAGIQDGWEWTRTWSRDSEVISTVTEAWNRGTVEASAYDLLASDSGLPPGRYTFTLSVRGSVVAEGSCQVLAGPSGRGSFSP